MPSHLIHSDEISLQIGQLLQKRMAAADMLGRTQIVRDVLRKTGKLVPIATSSRFLSHFSEDDASVAFDFKLPANGSADYLRSLTPVTKDLFDGLATQYKRDAFTIAGVTDVRLIEKVRDELADVMQKGGTLKEFEAAVAKLTSNTGVADIMSFTLDTVFTTNMQKAYSLGRYDQMKDPAVMQALPVWQYMTVDDDRVRPEHAAIDGFQANGEDAVWNKIYPPNGFNCRCMVIALLASEAEDHAREPGYARLPELALRKVPQPGFAKVFKIAA